MHSIILLQHHAYDKGGCGNNRPSTYLPTANNVPSAYLPTAPRARCSLLCTNDEDCTAWVGRAHVINLALIHAPYVSYR